MIVVFGSLNIDLILPVHEFPVPGETTFCDDYVWLTGGKGMNQAVAAARAGSKVVMVGSVGSDGFAQTLLSALENDNIDTQHVKRSDKSSGCATVMVDSHGENQILVARGANALVTASQLEAFDIDESMLFVMQMEVPIPEIEKAIRYIKQRGGRVMLNVAPSRPFDYSLCEDIDILVLNQVEAADMATRLGMGESLSEQEIAQKISARFKLSCVVTLGAKGSLVCTEKQEIAHAKAFSLGDVVDTTGAGDCYCGVLAASLEQGFSFVKAMERASIASGLSVLERGAQTGMPAKVKIDEYFEKALSA